MLSADQLGTLPSWWCAMQAPDPECTTLHEMLDGELAAELHPTHPLAGAEVRAVAHDLAYDDVLYQHFDERGRFTGVHLTWSGKEEVEGCPSVECDGDWDDFLSWNGAIVETLRQADEMERAGLRTPMGDHGTPSRPLVVRPPDDVGQDR